MTDREKIDAKRNEMVQTLVSYIEKHPTDWHSGWISLEAPTNGRTNTKYRGINALYLWLIGKQRDYKDNRWVTFNQAKELGASVKKGEKSSTILYYALYDKNTKKEYTRQTTEAMTAEERKQYEDEFVRPVVRYSQVFNAEQCYKFPEKAATSEMSDEERLHQSNATIERIIANSAAPVKYDGGDRAFYNRRTDDIHLPTIQQFLSMQDYYATALHEIAHSTGHPTRLNREMGERFGDKKYAIEELRAELAAVFMQMEHGLQLEGKHIENHSAYIASWLEQARKDTKVFTSAVSDAMKISDYITEHYATKDLVATDEQASEATTENTKEQVSEDMEPIVLRSNSRFAEQVDAVLSGADAESTHLKVMDTPFLLRQVGAPNLPILMTAKHLKTVTQSSGNDSANYHGLDVEIVKRLPELLSDPVMIMDSLTRKDSIVVVTETLDKENRPVIGAVMFDGKGYQNQIEIDANILTSTYGRNNFQNFLNKVLQENKLLYWNKEKSQTLFEIPGIQFPDNLKQVDFDIIIRKSNAFVNTQNKKSLESTENNEIAKPKLSLLVSEKIPSDAKSVYDVEGQPSGNAIVGLFGKVDARKYNYGIVDKGAGNDGTGKHWFEAGADFDIKTGGFGEVYGTYQDLLQAEQVIQKRQKDKEVAATVSDSSSSTNNAGHPVIKLRMTEAEATIFSEFVKARNDPMNGSKQIFDMGVDRPKSEDFWKGLSFLGEVKQTDMDFSVKFDRSIEFIPFEYEDITTKKIDEVVNKSTEAEKAQKKNQSEQTAQAASSKKWQRVVIPTECIGKEYGARTMVNIPKSSGYVGFAMFVPTKLLQKQKDGTVTLSFDSNKKDFLKAENDGRVVFFDGETLDKIMRGEKVPYEAKRVRAGKEAQAMLNQTLSNIPIEMQEMERWCVHQKYTEKNAEGKTQVKKRIFDVNRIEEATDNFAKCNDAATWASIERATAAVRTSKKSLTGLTFVVGDGISVIDLDHCFDSAGNPSPLAKDLMAAFEGTYMEKSMSGTGLHIFAKGDLRANNKFGKVNKGDFGDIEVYDESKFMSVTGNIIGDVRSLGTVTAAQQAAVQKYLKANEETAQKKNAPKKQSFGIGSVSDDDVIEKIRASKRGAEFDSLFAGHKEGQDWSREDYALINIIAFFTPNQDRNQIQHIFEHSGLYRPKKGDKYLHRTIDVVLSRLKNPSNIWGNQSTSASSKAQGSFTK